MLTLGDSVGAMRQYCGGRPLPDTKPIQSSFDGMDSDDMTIEQIVHGPPEYSKWENRN